MATQNTWWVDDRDPAYSDQITVAGAGYDLSSKAAQFKMRAVGSSTLKVDAAVTTKDASGNFTYAWAVGDLDTGGQYLAWVEVTVSAGVVQTLYEALITVLDHSGGVQPVYVEPEQLKSSLELQGQTFADQDLLVACRAASRGIDAACSRRFYLDADATSVRYYTPAASRSLEIDDLVTLTSVLIDRGGDGTFEETWTDGTDFVLDPLNAAADYWPYERIVNRRSPGRVFPCVEKSVKVTGRFGWPSVPDDIALVTGILATRFFKRAREAPFGVVTVGVEVGAAMRIARTDPEIAPIVAGYSRARPFL